jgi:hypothetical protein
MTGIRDVTKIRDKRFQDVEFQKSLARKLTHPNPIERRVAVDLLKRNGADVEWATEEARKYMATQKEQHR